jgi:catalase
MPQDTKPGAVDALSKDLLAAIDKVFGFHAGHRPVHAKGVMCGGTFTPAPGAAQLTRAPHASRASTPVLVRFSDAGGPLVADNDATGSNPKAMAVRFNLADHVHTDIIAQAADGFPVRTPQEFLELLTAIAASGPNAPKPTPLEKFLASHPATKRAVETKIPVPASFATQTYFAVTAFRFTSAGGQGRFGRFRIVPDAGDQHLSPADAASKGPNFLVEEMAQRLAKGAARFRVLVQVADDSDNVTDATVPWPANRPLVDFGTIKVTSVLNQDAPELRKIIFDPIPRVDGIDPSDDPLIPVRSAIYLLSGRRRRAAAS